MANDHTSLRVPFEKQREEVGETTDLTPLFYPLVALNSYAIHPQVPCTFEEGD
jgi:hypothetical protein